MNKRMKRVLVFVLATLVVLLARPASQHARAAVLLRSFSDASAHGDVLEERFDFGGVSARLYTPRGGAKHGVVLVHGVHHLGIEEPRLERFARALAGAGVVVMTPAVKELSDYKVAPHSLDTIGAAVNALRLRLGTEKVGLMGMSFGGGLSLLTASDPRFADRISFVVAVGAHDDLASGQSTFMVEMNETANILNNATPRSLVILDEVGRGTSTYDGLALAWAITEYLHAVGVKTLFATHYHHLNELEKTLAGVKNFRVAVKEQGDHIVWLRKIMPGGTDKSYGIQVAKLAGVPDPVLRRAREVLKTLESMGKGEGAVGGTDAGERLSSQTHRLQATLFEAERHPVLEELESLDLGTLSPIESLTKLYELQRKLTAG